MADVIIDGEFVSYKLPDETRAGMFSGEKTIRAHRYLKGSGPSDVTASWEWCEDPNAARGTPYVAFLRNYDGRLVDSPCLGSSPTSGSSPGTNLGEVKDITGPGIPPNDALLRALPAGVAAASFPVIPAAVAATLGPLVFLAGATFVWRRKEGAA